MRVSSSSFSLRTIGLLASLLVGTIPASSWAGEVNYSAAPYESQGVQINVAKIFHKSGKVWFRWIVINKTGRVLAIDKNQIQCQFPDGRVTTRAMGVFGKYAKPSTIAAGLSAELNIECAVGDLPQPVAVVLRQGFIVDGQSLPLPDYQAVPGGR